MEDAKPKPTLVSMESVQKTSKEKASPEVAKIDPPTAPPAPVTPPPTPTPPSKKRPTPAPLTYRLNLYNGNGQLRSEIGKGVFYDMSRKYGDIIRAIRSRKFQTVDELCDVVWAAERRNFNRGHDRTRPQIEEAIKDLAESGILLTRSS